VFQSSDAVIWRDQSSFPVAMSNATNASLRSVAGPL
jgi:hypothetical protein